MDIVDEELPDADVLDVWRETCEKYADEGEGYDYSNNKRDDERTKMTMKWTS